MVCTDVPDKASKRTAPYFTQVGLTLKFALRYFSMKGWMTSATAPLCEAVA